MAGRARRATVVPFPDRTMRAAVRGGALDLAGFLVREGAALQAPPAFVPGFMPSAPGKAALSGQYGL
jgi:hypothetical protein